jgi:hypothetical protein
MQRSCILIGFILGLKDATVFGKVGWAFKKYKIRKTYILIVFMPLVKIYLFLFLN